MRYSLIVFFFCMGIHFAPAQTYEIGLILGGTNFVGDVGSQSFLNPKDYLSQDKISYGGIFKWNRSPRHAFRFTVMKVNTFGSDLRSDEPRKRTRAYAFETDITELSLGLEFNFLDWDLHALKRPLVTPYLYTGPTYFFTNEFYVENNDVVEGNSTSNFAIPMVIGVKGILNRHWILAAEFGARYTFTDNLDGSAPEEINSQTNYPTFGNFNMNDWYIFSGITLTYTFGRKPCYFNF
ncbi:hypothetical protein G3567_01350 [Psychroflexus sp. YR1-1]|uniref:DUF6089 domain-containing protein n=1 Tax=Psychroflexus aurantiacus TaxID=2709310 RepID=A0A6B3R0A4_9FLAO|nr:DUF6089 family protein [Psychroflexus aurantiacus]NEV92790.1 hypothetical protein [Psychroflexus aurantiacus]